VHSLTSFLLCRARCLPWTETCLKQKLNSASSSLFQLDCFVKCTRQDFCNIKYVSHPIVNNRSSSNCCTQWTGRGRMVFRLAVGSRFAPSARVTVRYVIQNRLLRILPASFVLPWANNLLCTLKNKTCCSFAFHVFGYLVLRRLWGSLMTETLYWLCSSQVLLPPALFSSQTKTAGHFSTRLYRQTAWT
jgi:hypothetical protein